MFHIPDRESLTVEFKSEPSGGLSDSKVLEAVLGMCNAEGGLIFLGIEDSGRISGISDPQSKWRDEDRIRAFVAEHTRPHVWADAEVRTSPQGLTYSIIRVPRMPTLTAGIDSRVLKRRLKADGTPENLPVYPYEYPQELAALQQMDPSACLVPGSTLSDLSPLERHRLRTFVRNYHGDQPLLNLSDEELDYALGFLRRDPDGTPKPTLCGLLMIGEPSRLKELIPTARSTFQHLDGTRVLTNEDVDLPILASLEQLLMRFRSCNAEREFYKDLVRIRIPDFSEAAFREALVNAFCHRDYACADRIRVTVTEDRLEIASPGGFINGIGPDNVLTANPRGRNPLLADVMKRIGLAERTGRGIDVIFENTLRFGRPWPSYAASTPWNVLLRIPKYGEDFDFFHLINTYESAGNTSLAIFPMMVLSVLHIEGGCLSLKELTELLPGDLERGYVRALADHLVKTGLLMSDGHAKNPSYALHSDAIGTSEFPASPPSSFAESKEPPHDREGRVLNFVLEKGSATRSEVADALGLRPQTAYRALIGLVRRGKLRAEGEKRSRTYLPTSK